MNEFNPYESPLADTRLPETEARLKLRNRHMHRRLALLSYTLGAAVGGCLWAFSQTAFGHQEPWNGDYLLYYAYLLFARLSTALLCPRFAWSGVLGVYVGQVAYVIFFEGVNIALATIAIAVFGLWPALIGALLGALVGWWAPWNRR